MKCGIRLGIVTGFCAILFLLVPSGLAADDPVEIVRRSVNADSRNWELAKNYTFIQRNVKKDVDSKGKVTSQETATYEVMNLYGQPYSKLIARNDKPLAPKEAKKVQEKLDKLVADRERETDQQRGARLVDYDKRRQRQREYFREIPDAFDLRLLGEEQVSGHDAWKIEATPKPGYKAHSPQANRIFPKVRGILWIDKAGYQWVKFDAETTDTITFGGFVARLAKGARFQLEQARINDEVWLPFRVQGAATARVLLVKRMGAEFEVTFNDYRKFQADSRVLPEP